MPGPNAIVVAKTIRPSSLESGISANAKFEPTTRATKTATVAMVRVLSTKAGLSIQTISRPRKARLASTDYRRLANQSPVVRELSSFMKTAAAGGRGPSPSFTRAHFLLAFLTIGTSGLIGRQALAREAGLGEGAARTVLKRLREGGYVEVNASGAYLSKKGKGLLMILRGRLLPLVHLERSRLTVGNEQSAVGVRGGGRRLGNGILQRDSAIMVGATGATTYSIRGSKFTIPGESTDCEKDYPSTVWKLLRKKLVPKGGDVVIVCGAEEELKARLGALSAALTLL